MEFPLPSVEEQERLVATSEQWLKATVNEYFPKEGEEHKTFRLMVKNLLAPLKATPASPSTKWHGAWAGGLLVHTVEVIKTAMKLADMLLPEIPDPDSTGRSEFMRSVIKTGFLHDIGKLGDGEHPYYLEQDNEWRKENLGEMFVINRDLRELTYMPIPVRGLWMAQRFGVYLTPEETQAIVSSDGPQTELGKIVATFLETPLTMVIHFADKWVSQVRGA